MAEVCVIIGQQTLRMKFKIKNYQGFSLIELLVVMAIMSVTAVGAIVFINRSNSEQKVMATRNQLVANLRMARNYARTLRVPTDYREDLEYVAVDLTDDGVMTVYPMPRGDNNYLETDISADGVVVAMEPKELCFAAYEGKLVKVVGENVVPREVDEVVTMVISSSEGVGRTEVVVVNSIGVIGGESVDQGGEDEEGAR